MSSSIPLLLRNENFIAVNKPPGLSIHNTEDSQNLISVLEQQLKTKTLLPVHRLDKETSGIQVLAFNSATAQKLAKEFEQRAVRKIYHGISRGILQPSEGVWDSPLTDKAEGRKSPAGHPSARVPCRTEYKVLRSSAYFSLCEFDLKTGRQHQIRKHAALYKHALVGDDRYGDPRYNLRMVGIYKCSRMFLHSSQLEFLDFKIEAPLPPEFAALLDPS